MRDKLLAQIEAGQEEHSRLWERKVFSSGGGVVGRLSDLVGGADLPSEDIWRRPRELVTKGVIVSTQGDTRGYYAYLIASSLAIRANSKLLAEYARKSSDGAGSVATFLTVLKVAGEIAQTIVLAYDITGIAISGGVAISAKLAARSAARNGTKAAGSSVDDIAKKALNDYLEKNPGLADDLGGVTVVPGPKGNIGGGIKPGSNDGMGGRPNF